MKRLPFILSSCLLAILVIAALLLAVPRIFGVRMYAVLSGSMTPALRVGDLIYVVPEPSKNIEPGNIISFVINNNLTVVTHRVFKADRVNRQFTTKGDANSSPDGSPVIYANVIGVERFKIPKLGYALKLVNTIAGRFMLTAAIILTGVLAFLLSSDDKKNKQADSQ